MKGIPSYSLVFIQLYTRLKGHEFHEQMYGREMYPYKSRIYRSWNVGENENKVELLLSSAVCFLFYLRLFCPLTKIM